MIRKIELIIPTHNEQEVIPELIKRINNVRDTIDNFDIHLTFIDDSNDDTQQIIEDQINKFSYIKLIKLVRQFGQTNAIYAGLNDSNADAVIIMDADLQDPPEEIPKLLDQYDKGSDIVLVKRESEKKNFIYTFFSKTFYIVQKFLSETNIPENVGEFRLLSKRAYKFVASLNESTTYLRGVSMWPGYRYSIIEITRSDRLLGKTKYNFSKSLSVALDGIFSFSSKPLRLISFLSFIMLFLGISGVLYSLFLRLFTDSYVPGNTIIFISLLLFTGIQLLVLGIISEYILRISNDIKNRPKYMIDFIRTKKQD